MTVETDIRARLVADGTVNGLVSSRIYPLKLPQKPTLPAITYSRISGIRSQLLGGSSTWGFGRIEINGWATSYVQAQSIAAAVRTSLNGFVGKLNSRPSVIRLENERDLYEDEDEIYRVIQDYLVNHLD
jgi:hypothetical protein